MILFIATPKKRALIFGNPHAVYLSFCGLLENEKLWTSSALRHARAQLPGLRDRSGALLWVVVNC